MVFWYCDSLEVGWGSKSEFYLTMTVTCTHGTRPLNFLCEVSKGRGPPHLGHTKTHQPKIGLQLYLGYNNLF